MPGAGVGDVQKKIDRQREREREVKEEAVMSVTVPYVCVCVCVCMRFLCIHEEEERFSQRLKEMG